MPKAISQTHSDFDSLPTTGIKSVPYIWKKQKAIRDIQLAQQKQKNYWICEGAFYDLKPFIDLHPGGKSWLKNTEGHDITQLFITHHLDQQKARKILKKYYIRDCKRKIQRFTFEENGLYRTVKRRILQKYKVQEIQNQLQSIKEAWIILFIFFILISMTAYFRSYVFASVSGITMMGIFGVMHNFIHHRENGYSKLVKLTGFSFNDFQIMHCISHHIYVNTELDFEVTGMQPIAYWLRSKPQNKFYTQIIIQPILAIASSMNIIMNLTVFPFKLKKMPDWDYVYPLIIFIYMYTINGEILTSLKLWFCLYIFYSFFFFKILLCEHRMPELWTQGNPRILDFGEHTIASTSDVNPTVRGIASFLFLAGFNLHTIHHFFPTADHNILPKLNEILQQVCRQRKIKYHSMGRIQCAVKFTKGMRNRSRFDLKQQ